MRIKVLLFLFTLFISINVTSQVRYGSNNGKYLTIKDTKIYYEEYGKGIPLLLIHGAFGGINDFENVIPLLSKKYRVIISDAPGLGRSEFPKNKLSYNLLAEYQSEIINKLKLDSLYVLGWNDGAITGLILTKNRPDKVEKLVISGANYKANGSKNLEELRNWSNPDWIEKNWPNWVNHYKINAPKNNDWKKYVNETKDMWFEEQYFPKSVLESIKVPTLITYGDNDMYTLEHGIEIHNAINKSQFCVIPNCSHDVFAEKPELITKLVFDFFNNK